MNASIERAVNEVNKSMNAQVSRRKTGNLSITKKALTPKLVKEGRLKKKFC